MEEIEVVLQWHEQQIKTLERDMTDMKTVQAGESENGRPAGQLMQKGQIF